jgi:glutamate dehydrogenase (NAD(P)+)
MGDRFDRGQAAPVALHDPKGFDLEAVLRHVRQAGVLKGFAQQAEIDPETLLTSECDVLVPAAIERVIDGRNAGALKCRIIAEGANGPTMPDADTIIEGGGATSSSCRTFSATSAASS